MKKPLTQFTATANHLPAVLVVLAASLIIIGYQFWQYLLLSQELVLTRNEFASTTSVLANKLKNLNANLAEVTERNNELTGNLTAERERNDNFENQIESITDKVGVLDKLSKTDPQLLEKYSKIYFLNEHYVPAKLIDIESPYSYQKDDQKEPEQILASVWPYLGDLLKKATRDGINLQVISGYRSFGEQTSLKSSYKFTYGAGTANQFSADQGYSEHQLGTTVDFTTPEVGATFKNFGLTPAYKWLLDNAHQFGFTLSYPEDNTYYQFEPWHWRFVGVNLATKLQRDNNHFYDLDQRVINRYLVDLFD